MADEAPLVGIIMGSRSDWETMRHAAETLDALGVALRDQGRLGAPHARPPLRLCQERRRARPQGDRRRRRRRGASARHGRLDDPAAGARRAGRDPRRWPASTACSRSSRCPPACRSARWRSARPARSMPACSPPRSSPPSDDALAARLEAWRKDADRRRRRKAGMIVPPGSTIGIIGGGQLGRMLALAAAQLGYRCHVYAPDADSVAAEVAARFTQGAFDDEGALTRFAAEVDVATYEFENIPTAPLARARRDRPLYPPRRGAGDRPGPARARRTSSSAIGGRPAPFARGRRPGGARRRAGRDRHPGHPEDAALRL